MAKQIVNPGVLPNDGTGDSLRVGAEKLNENFNELYTTLGDGNNLLSSDIDFGTNKIFYQNSVDTVNDLSTISPTTYAGLIILVRDEGAVYYANAGTWHRLLTDDGDKNTANYNDSLAAAAYSGDYNDLRNKPFVPSSLVDLNIEDGSAGQILSTDGTGNFTFRDLEATTVNFEVIYNKPVTLAGYGITDAFSGDWSDILNKPDLFDGDFANLTNVPTIPADVNELTDTDNLLFDGSYLSLVNKPVIPTDLSQLTDNESLLASSFSGSYNDLTEKPTFFTNLSSLSLTLGANIDEFSIDGTFASNSTTKVPVEQAVKTYVDTAISSFSAVGNFDFTDSTMSTSDSSDITITENIIAGGTLSTTGDLTIASNAAIGGDLSVTGNSTITGNESVIGNLDISGTLDTAGTLGVTGDATLASNVAIGGDLAVVGNSTTTGNSTVSGNETISGDLTVTGALNTGSLNLTGTGTYNFTSNTDIEFTAGNSIIMTASNNIDLSAGILLGSLATFTYDDGTYNSTLATSAASWDIPGVGVSNRAAIKLDDIVVVDSTISSAVANGAGTNVEVKGGDSNDTGATNAGDINITGGSNLNVAATGTPGNVVIQPGQNTAQGTFGSIDIGTNGATTNFISGSTVDFTGVTVTGQGQETYSQFGLSTTFSASTNVLDGNYLTAEAVAGDNGAGNDIANSFTVTSGYTKAKIELDASVTNATNTNTEIVIVLERTINSLNAADVKQFVFPVADTFYGSQYFTYVDTHGASAGDTVEYKLRVDMSAYSNEAAKVQYGICGDTMYTKELV